MAATYETRCGEEITIADLLFAAAIGIDASEIIAVSCTAEGLVFEVADDDGYHTWISQDGAVEGSTRPWQMDVG